MNFLAHFHLSPPMADALVGAYLGDFVRGPIECVPDLPLLMRQGITLHRKVDAFTDKHPVWRASGTRLDPSLRRLSGVVIDIVYDHFLCLHWNRFASSSLEEFAQHCYSCLLSRTPWMSLEARRGVRRMKDQDWIRTYCHMEGIDLAFQRLSHRSPALAILPSASSDLRRHQQALEEDFLCFYPELVQFARACWKEICPPAVYPVTNPK
jgi:acyl carrier protein phosphodiesterase